MRSQCGLSRMDSSLRARSASAALPLCAMPVSRVTSSEKTHRTSPETVPARHVKTSTMRLPSGAGMLPLKPKNESVMAAGERVGASR